MIQAYVVRKTKDIFEKAKKGAVGKTGLGKKIKTSFKRFLNSYYVLNTIGHTTFINSFNLQKSPIE